MNSNGVDGSTTPRRKVDPAFVLFVSLTTILSGVVAIAARFADELWLTSLIPIVPGAVAVVLLVVNKQFEKLRALAGSLLNFSAGSYWWVTSLFLFPLIAFAAVGLYAVTGSTEVHFGTVRLEPVIVAIPLMLATEFGWRGYAASLLSRRTGAFSRSLIVGAAWIVSVAPIYLVPQGLSAGVALYQVVLALIPVATITFWLRVNTGSLFMPALFGSSAIVMTSLLPILPGDAAQGVTFWLVVALLWVTAVLVVFYYGSDGLDRSIRELPADELPVDWERIMPKSKPVQGPNSKHLTHKQRAKKFSGVAKKSRR